MQKKLKIVSISSELDPFSKTGGLADVARSLPKALKRLGHDVLAITPLYGKTADKKKHSFRPVFRNIEVKLNSEESVTVNFWQGYLMEDLPVYFVENTKYFSRKSALYGSSHENVRFFVFNIACLKLLSLLKYKADIIHCHDWHTGLIPYLLKTEFRNSATLSHAKTVFTIHNLAFQLGHNWWEIPSLKKDFGKNRLPLIGNPDFENINFAKRGILHADVVNTVSEQYREEIMTKKFGQDLDRILKNREDRLFGIINGIDYNAYNPKKDPGLVRNYDHKKISAKKINKCSLQKKLGLEEKTATPIICSTSRVTFQKGFELILKALEPLLRLDIQFIIMGDGDKRYIGELKKANKKHQKKLVWLPFLENRKLETLIYSGSDMFMMPSHHEPCGINQLIAMRYGCIPIVRSVGGLYDTVSNYHPGTGKGTGFSFHRFDHYSLFAATVRALENFRHKEAWNSLVERAMLQSSSWEIPAKKYVRLYHIALKKI